MVEDAVSKNTLKVAGKVIVINGAKAVAHTVGGVAADILFPDPTATAEKDCIKPRAVSNKPITPPKPGALSK